MADVPPRMRHGRQSAPVDERPGPIDLENEAPERERVHERERERGHRHSAPPGDFSPENDDERRLAQIEEWTAIADRRLDRLDSKIDRLAVALDQLNSQLNAVLTEMPTRRGINLYLVGGLVGGLAVGLAIMGITIGGFVGGLSSLRSNNVPMMSPSVAPAPANPAPIIIQMPQGMGMMPGTMVPAPSAPATGTGH